jgi:hypothetical protein
LIEAGELTEMLPGNGGNGGKDALIERIKALLTQRRLVTRH